MAKFGKPAAWKKLSDEDKQWVEGLKKTRTSWRDALEAEIKADNLPRVEYLWSGSGFFTTENKFVTLAIEHDAVKSFGFFLAGIEKGDSEYWDGYRRQMQKSIIEHKAEKALKCFFHQLSYLTLKEQLCVDVTASGWKEGIVTCLDELAPDQARVYNMVTQAVMAGDGELIDTVLKWKQKFPKDVSRTALDGALMQAINLGDIEKTRIVLSHGADPNYSSGLPVVRAAEKGLFFLLQLVVESGADMAAHGAQILARLETKSIFPEIMAYLDKAAASARKEEQAAKAAAEQAPLQNPRVLVETMFLPDGVKLTTLFNFETRQQVILADSPGNSDGPSHMAMVVKDFTEIADPAVIDRARAKLKDRGGIADDGLLPDAGPKVFKAKTAAP